MLASYRVSARFIPPEYHHGLLMKVRRVGQIFYVRLWARPDGCCRCPIHMAANAVDTIWDFLRKKLK